MGLDDVKNSLKALLSQKYHELKHTYIYDIIYDDGETEYGVANININFVSRQHWKVGDEVWHQPKNDDIWYSGNILIVNDNSTYDIKDDLGYCYRGVGTSLIRPVGSEFSVQGPLGSKNPYQEGDGIKVDYKGKGSCFPGKISNVTFVTNTDAEIIVGLNEDTDLRNKIRKHVIKRIQREYYELTAGTDRAGSSKIHEGVKIQ